MKGGKSGKKPARRLGKDTRLANVGRQPEKNHGIVNPPVYHASTVVFPTVAELEAVNRPDFEGVRYGRVGTPTTFALEEAVAEIEEGHRAIITGSGLAAIVAALTAFLKSGDHLLMVDTAYGPTRRFADTMLAGFGVETTYYDPTIGAGIAGLMRDNTRVVYTESPGSLTFEMQDIAAIATAAHAGGAVLLMDNTWGVLHFKPFEHGVDVSIQAATKYIVGHSDAMLGTVTTNEASYAPVRAAALTLGAAAGPDDVYLGLRGIRSLAIRLKRHHENGVAVAQWLRSRPEVERVLHPALPDDPGHELWKRDFSGACGLFGVILKPVAKAAIDAMLDGMDLFAMGYSWGGYESLILPARIASTRSATVWPAPDRTLRLHVGLEDPADLIGDLEAGFERLNAHAR